MNDMFQNQLEQCIVVFLDDILIYSRTLDEHGKHLRFVIQTLCDKKCMFFRKSITCLGHLITEQDIQIYPS